MLKYLSFLLLIIVFTTDLIGQNRMPEKPLARVNDYADVLSATQERDLEGMLSGLETRSSNQIFIAIFRNLPENNYLEDFTVKLYEKWRPGLADSDNGILMVIFINDKKMRIEVGYGLEDVVTDAQAGRIISDYMTPHFQKNDYYGGLRSALEVLIPAAEGKYQIPLKPKSTKGEKTPLGWFSPIIIMFIILFIIFRKRRQVGYGTRGRGGSYMGPILWGGGGRSGGGFSGGGFSGGFGGMSGGGGASGSW